ncbi:MAG: RidA family protein [Gemmatimonadetes bacterium]|nr:RidA family protein [Gemmatimonadota bacterium]
MSGRERRPARGPDLGEGPAATPPGRACMMPALAALATILACGPPPPPGEDARQEDSAMPEPTPIEHIVPEGVARLPVFTPAVRVGDLVFLSGAIGTPPSGELRVVEGGVGAETRATMDNIGRILEAAGLGFADLVKCTVFLADMADYAEMNEAYVTYFEGIEPPARSAMAGSGLALGARVEIECIARGR